MTQRYGPTPSRLRDSFAAILPHAKIVVAPDLVFGSEVAMAGIACALEELVEDYRRVSESVIELCFVRKAAHTDQSYASTEMIDGGVRLSFYMDALITGSACSCQGVCGHIPGVVAEHYGRSADDVVDNVVRTAYGVACHEWGHVIGYYRTATAAGHWNVQSHLRSGQAGLLNSVPPVACTIHHMLHHDGKLPSEYATFHPMEAVAEVFAASRLGMDWWDQAGRWAREWVAWLRETELLVDTTRATVGA